ncbi:hypothetical protein CFC21_090770 [Triticum aestivum]|uniref:F-box domain-containing protein n=2 Tax=Triticum aestivum TaxID=4565 RepID=A0A9R1MSB4_WHEAT|nr:uncharacterized protein LOC123140673 [Triticum aestivum]KAF7087596.1 hypothetical protein CFC21_090770 [Triticum aestivum]
MDPAAETPQGQGADTFPTRVDGSRLRCSVPLADPVSEVLGDDNLLIEILVRLPPKPSSLSRASAVSKRWGSILYDPQFRKSFLKHHRMPPLLGFFRGYAKSFIPAMDSPDRIPAARFSLPKSTRSYHTDEAYMGCRHGLSVLIDRNKHETVVWDPLTGKEHIVSFPPGFHSMRTNSAWHGAVLCVDAKDGHVHGDCFSSPFKLVLVSDGFSTQASCSLYDSASSVWGNIFSVTIANRISATSRSILVGNTLCWLICGGEVLVFDFEMQSLVVIKTPVENHVTNDRCFQLLRMADGGLGLAGLLDLNIHLWDRKSNCEGIGEWVLLRKTIPLDEMLPRRISYAFFVGYDEESNLVVLSTMIGNFTLQIDSMQIKHIVKRNQICHDTFHPYRNFYAAGSGFGRKGTDLAGTLNTPDILTCYLCQTT